MFKSLKRIVYTVTDLESARRWYADLLGAQPVFDAPFAAIFVVGPCSLSLARSTTGPIDPDKQVPTYWEVDDIDAAFQRLIDAGAKPFAPIKEVLNIRTAQVVDPFGNLIGLTGPVNDAEHRTVEQKPSETAMSAAFCRALAARDDRQEIRGPDILAELFVEDKGRSLLRDSASRTWAIQNLVTSPLYGYFFSRTAYFDAVFTTAIGERIPQVVFLGAGYDTRAYRYRQSLGDTRVFELDISSTQERKRSILRDAKIAIPKNVSLVSINFKTDSLEDVLANAGFDPHRKTLFVWEGVTYYLKEDAVRSTLTFVTRHSTPGSSICFDYMTSQLESVNAAEPFLFWIRTTALKELLGELGLDLLEHIDSQLMEKRYLTLRNGTVAERVLTQFCFAHAVVAV
jgi:methyltransferase (TIGR00027 family)